MKFTNIIYPYASFKVICLRVIRKPYRAFITRKLSYGKDDQHRRSTDGVEAAWSAELRQIRHVGLYVVLTTAATTSSSQWCVDVEDPCHLGVEQVCIFARVRLNRTIQVRSQNVLTEGFLVSMRRSDR